MRDGLAVRVVLLALIASLLVFFTHLGVNKAELVFVPQEARNEIMSGFGDVFSHFDKLGDSNIFTPHQAKTGLYRVRKRKVEDIV